MSNINDLLEKRNDRKNMDEINEKIKELNQMTNNISQISGNLRYFKPDKPVVP